MRRSQVTRLGDGVDAGGALSRRGDRARLRHARATTARRSTSTAARPTSPCSPPPCATPPTAPRSPRACASDYGLDARVLTGEEEAQLTFLGAMSGRAARQPSPPSSSTSAAAPPSSSSASGAPPASTSRCHAGVVRMSERHIHSDPPAPRGAPGARPATSAPRLPRRSARRRARARQARHRRRRHRHLRRRRSTRSSTPTTPRACTATRCMLATVELLLARLADMDEAAAPRRRRAATPTARPRSSPA